jgi:ATP-dependent RNA helicase DeaD
MTTFNSFGLPSFLNDSLTRMGITVPTPIQVEAIPSGLLGTDILASAQTGTGKTIAYLIPLITNLLKSSQSSALILAPTRELATQILEAARALLSHKTQVALLIGGDSMHKQISALKRNPRLIVGTPGRINDHLGRRTLRLEETRFLVLDETDRMLDMGFTEDLKKIVSHLPRERQTFMFSATMPESIKKLSSAYLTNPQHICVGSTTEPVLKIKQESFQVSNTDKFPHLLKELEAREGSVIIFVKTKHGADRLAEKLTRQNHHATAIHGDLKQRKRDEVIRDFRNLKNRIMVATDVAARGLDIPHIMHVINYDLPQCPEDYIHRIGRTGRAGMEGFALSLISPEEGHKWRRIHNLIHPGKYQESSTESQPRRKGKPRPFQNAAAPSKRPFFKRDAATSESPKRNDSKPSSQKGRDFKKTDFKKADFKKPDFKRGAPKRSSEKRSSSQRSSWA